MKGFTRICLLVSLVCVCIGVVCLGAGAVLGSGLREVWAMVDDEEFCVESFHIGGWNIPFIITDNGYEEGFENVKVKKGMVEQHFSAQEVKNLEIDIKYGEVILTDSDSDQIEITVDAPEQNQYKCSLNGKTVVLLDQTSRRIWKRGIGKEVTVTIAIPKETVFDEVELTTNAGAVDISHHIKASEVQLELDAGELIAQQITAEEELLAHVGAGNLEIEGFETEFLEVDCGVGTAKLIGDVLKDADVDCGMGQITLNLSGRRDDYNYDIDCGLGVVDVNGESYSSLSVDKQIDNDTDRTISLKCGMGEIDIFVKEEE